MKDTHLRAAMAAPTAGNKQTWRFVVIRDNDLRSWISSNFPTMTMVGKAPLAIVICGDVNATFPTPKDKSYQATRRRVTGQRLNSHVTSVAQANAMTAPPTSRTAGHMPCMSRRS